VTYRERLDVRRRYLALEPDNIGRLEGVSASLDKIGDLMLQANDLAGAFNAFEEELEFDRKIYLRDQNRKLSQSNLVFSLKGWPTCCGAKAIARARPRSLRNHLPSTGCSRPPISTI
jgi:hypothetical protein